MISSREWGKSSRFQKLLNDYHSHSVRETVVKKVHEIRNMLVYIEIQQGVGRACFSPIGAIGWRRREIRRGYTYIYYGTLQADP